LKGESAAYRSTAHVLLQSQGCGCQGHASPLHVLPLGQGRPITAGLSACRMAWRTATRTATKQARTPKWGREALLRAERQGTLLLGGEAMVVVGPDHSSLGSRSSTPSLGSPK
jgi:hypothetical protein